LLPFKTDVIAPTVSNKQKINKKTLLGYLVKKESDPTRHSMVQNRNYACSECHETEVVFAVKAMELKLRAKPRFVNLLRSPGIDSQPGGIDSLEFGLWYVEGRARGAVRRAEEAIYRTGRSCYTVGLTEMVIVAHDRAG
jgi:hypothetical protein